MAKEEIFRPFWIQPTYLHVWGAFKIDVATGGKAPLPNLQKWENFFF